MTKTSKARVTGPLAMYAEGFRTELAEMGYTAGSAEHHMYAMAHLSHWLLDEGLEPGELDVNRVRQFLPVMWLAAGVCQPKGRWRRYWTGFGTAKWCPWRDRRRRRRWMPCLAVTGVGWSRMPIPFICGYWIEHAAKC